MRSPDSTAALHHACRVLFRHGRKMAFFVVAVLGVTAAVTFFGPQTYRSQAKLLIRLGRENLALDPTATLGQTPVVTVPASRENDVNSVIEIFSSRILIEKVVDRVGPAAILGEGPLAPAAAEAPVAEAPEHPRVMTDRYRAILALRKMLAVEAVKKSNVVIVTCEARDPEVAQAVVACLTDLYLDRHIHLNRTPGAHRFLAEQATRLRQQLTQTEEQVRSLKDETGLVSPDGQRQVLVQRLGRLQDELLQAAAAADAAEAEVDALRGRLAQLPRTQETARTRGVINQPVDTMRGQLYALQLREQELLARHPENHPDVRQVRKQVAAARGLLDAEQQRDQVTNGPNRAYEETHIALLRQEPVLASLRVRAATLERQLVAVRADLKTLTRNEVRLARLQREMDLQASHYRKYAENLEQAQIDRALEEERISNINVIQPATYDLKPVRPRKGINLALGLVVALLGAVGLAFGAEYLDSSLRTPADVETQLGLPVLASIPHTRLPGLARTGRGEA